MAAVPTHRGTSCLQLACLPSPLWDTPPGSCRMQSCYAFKAVHFSFSLPPFCRMQTCGAGSCQRARPFPQVRLAILTWRAVHQLSFA